MSEEQEWIGLEDVPAIYDSRFLASLPENGSQPKQSSWTPRNLALVPDEPPVLPTLGGLNLVYPGKRHVFSGPQEAAKTLAAYVVGLSVVREGGRVMLIDFEMGERDAKRRLCELGASEQELGMIDYIEPDTPLTERKAEELVALEPKLVIIDASVGAYDLQGLDDNKRTDVERFAGLYIRPFWRSEIATLTIDHVVKNVETRGNYAIGSERKVGGVDVHLGFTVLQAIKRGTAGKYQVTTHKDRGGFHKRGKLATFELESHPNTHHFTWAFVAAPQTDEEHPFRPTVKMEQASKWLEKQMEGEVPMSHIEKGIGGDRDAGRLAIQLLVDEGYFAESPGPRNARLMTLVRPYREQHDDLSATSPDLSGEVALHDLSGSPLPLQGTEQSGGVVSRSGEVSSPRLEDDDGIPF